MAQLIADLPQTPASVSTVDGVFVGEGMQRADVNNAFRALSAMVKSDFARSANTLTAASVFTLASISTGDYIRMAPYAGQSITSFGPATDGLQKFLESTGTQILRNGASLSVQGGADLTLPAGDVVWARRDQSVWKARVQKADGSPVAVNPSFGKHLVPVHAAQMIPASLSGAAGVQFETGTNKHNFYGLLFDQSATEYAYFDIYWPKSADESTITWRFRGAAVSLSNSAVVIMKLQAVGVGNTDAEDAAFGTAQQCSISYSTANALGISPESPALTIANLAEGDLVQFRLWRDAQNTEDKLGADFRLRGVDIFITTNAENDA
jgi:hypothetical protein